MRHIVICGLSGYKTFFHIIPNGMIFEKKEREKSYWAQTVCFDFLYNNCLKYVSF